MLPRLVVLRHSLRGSGRRVAVVTPLWRERLLVMAVWVLLWVNVARLGTAVQPAPRVTIVLRGWWWWGCNVATLVWLPVLLRLRLSSLLGMVLIVNTTVGVGGTSPAIRPRARVVVAVLWLPGNDGTWDGTRHRRPVVIPHHHWLVRGGWHAHSHPLRSNVPSPIHVWGCARPVVHG